MEIHSNIVQCQSHQLRQFQLVVIPLNADQILNAESKTEFWLVFVRKVTSVIH